MDELISGRIAASLVAYVGDRDGRRAVRERLEDAPLAALASTPHDAWLDEGSVTTLAEALRREGETAVDLAREAGAAALTLEPMGGLAHLVQFLDGPGAAFRHLPHLLPLFLRGAVVRVLDDDGADATVDIALPDSAPVGPVLVTFAVGLFESFPTWWRIPRGRCDVSSAPGSDGIARLRFRITWHGDVHAEPTRPSGHSERPDSGHLGRVELVARLLREGMEGTVFEIDADGRVVLVEPGPEAPLGLNAAAPGRPLAALHPGWSAPPLRHALESAHRGRAEVVTTRMEEGVGARLFRVRLHPLPADDGEPHPLVGTVVDWTDAQQRQAELARTSRLSNVGRLAAATAHEFNNALTGILGYADLGLRTEDPARRERALSIIQETAAHAHRLAESLLHHARERPGPETPTAAVDLGEVVHRAVELLSVTTRSLPVRIVEDVGSVPPVRGRRHHYQQIVMNVLQNALDALGEEGGTVRIHARRDGSMIALEFEDDGQGMSDDVRRRVLEPFYTTKRDDDRTLGGSGLGLAVCDALAQEMGGAIRIDSSPGEGTRVTLVCPAAESPSEAGAGSPGGLAESAPLPAQAPSTPLEVLVVDDEEVVRTLLMDIATHEGHVVTGAEHGGEAWRLLAEHHYDVLFLDVLMPVMSGLELLGRLRDTTPRPRVVMMSGKLTPEVEAAVRDHAVAEVLTKPFPMQRITEILRRLVREQGRGDAA
ncbi:MAG: hybrid sensor histidine kinase/response regulator [Myxococcota bacterium]